MFLEVLLIIICVSGLQLFRDESDGSPYIVFQVDVDTTIRTYLRLKFPPGSSRHHRQVVRMLPFGLDRPLLPPIFRSTDDRMHLSIEWMLQSIGSSVNFVNDELIFGMSESDFLSHCVDRAALTLPRIVNAAGPIMGRVGFPTPNSEIGTIELSDSDIPPYLRLDDFRAVAAYMESLHAVAGRPYRGAVTFTNCTRETIAALEMGIDFLGRNRISIGQVYIPLPVAFDSTTNTCTLRFRSRASSQETIASFSPLIIPDTNVRITASSLTICDKI